jgi:CHAD domain-containing protein
MAFQLKKDETVGKGAKRLVRRQLDRALAALRRDGENDDHVHDARKRFKRIRAVLRLVRDELGEKVYGRANRCFRDAARPLTEVRDAKVLIETLDKLAEENIPRRLLRELRGKLQDHREAVRQRVLKQQNALTRVMASAGAGRAQLKEWHIAHQGWSALSGGLKRIYKAGRDAMAQATATPSVAHLHEWRKQAKYLWHQLQVLQPIRPELLGAWAERVHELTRLLGDDHDLAVLREKITSDSARERGGDVKKLLAAIDRRRTRLQAEARQLGQHIYRDKPKPFLKRVRARWKAWARD